MIEKVRNFSWFFSRNCDCEQICWQKLKMLQFEDCLPSDGFSCGWKVPFWYFCDKKILFCPSKMLHFIFCLCQNCSISIISYSDGSSKTNYSSMHWFPNEKKGSSCICNVMNFGSMFVACVQKCSWNMNSIQISRWRWKKGKIYTHTQHAYMRTVFARWV